MTPTDPAEEIRLSHYSKVLSEKKRLDVVLASLSGLGWVSAARLLLERNIHPTTTWLQLSRDQQLELSEFIRNNGCDETPLEARLKSRTMDDLRNLMRKKCYRGMRHKIKKRVRGQRTRTTNRVNRVLRGFQKKK